MSSISLQASPTDEQLAARISVRDESPGQWERAQHDFEDLYSRHARKLLAFLAGRVRRSDLEDVHQAVWERVWQHLPRQFKGGNFRAWLHQIARNHLIDRSRKKTTDELPDETGFTDDRVQQPEDVMIEQERMQALDRCLDQLDDEAARLVRARLAGESYDEICADMNLKPARAHKLFHQAKELLSVCVQREIE